MEVCVEVGRCGGVCGGGEVWRCVWRWGGVEVRRCGGVGGEVGRCGGGEVWR